MASFRYVFWALCGLIFIDGIGLGLIFPILAPVYLNASHAIVSTDMSLVTRNFYYGLTLAVFPLGLFFSAPLLGDFSDGLGRRKILIFAVYSVGLCYILSGLAIMEKSVWLLILSRFLAGCVSGSQPIAQAAIMDLSTPAKKAKNLSLILFFSSIGFTWGPLLGGWLSDATLLTWFNLSTPMYAAALASIVCGLALQFHFKETLIERRAVSFRLLYGVVLIYKALKLPEVQPFLIIGALLQIGWGCFFQIVPAYVSQTYAFTASQIGHFMAVIAVGFALAFCGCIAYLARRFNEVVVLKGSLVVVSLLFALPFLVPHEFVLWLIAAPLGFCVAIVYVLTMTLASNAVPASYQGWLMGANMGLMSAAWFISPLIGSAMLNWHPASPLMFSFAIAAMATVVAFRLRA